MTPKIWKTSTDGTDVLEYVSLTSETMEGALNVTRKGFFIHENICVAVGVPDEPKAIKELEELTLRAARDGVSLVAIDKSTKEIVGVAFNKLQVNNCPEDGTYFENYITSCKYGSSRRLIQFMIDTDATCDLFKLCEVDCLLELMFLAVLPKYRGRKIGSNLTQLSIELATKLFEGENVKQAFEIGKELSVQPVPKAFSTILSSEVSQKIGKKLNLNIAAIMPYENFFHNGKSFYDILGHREKNSKLMYTKL